MAPAHRVIGRDVELDARSARTEVVERHDGAIPPAADVGEDGAPATLQDLPFAEADLRPLLSHPNEVFEPVEERARVATLVVHVDPLEREGPSVDRWPHHGLTGRGGEAATGTTRPLHGGPDGVALRQRLVVAHPDLLPVEEDRRAR